MPNLTFRKSFFRNSQIGFLNVFSKNFLILAFSIATCSVSKGQTPSDSAKIKNAADFELIYYSSSAAKATASTGVINSADILKSPVTSFRNALSGRLAGLYSLQSSGLPGSDGASMTLRGKSPVIIIDGVVANLTTFDLEEIESITVLKDAIATAMLGVRGANGAVLVTTKKGKSDKQQISFTAQTATQQSVAWPKLLNAYDYATLHNEALRNDGVDSAYSGLYYGQNALNAYKNGTDPINYPNVDYRNQITNRNAQFSRYTFSTRGGNRYARYFVALEHANQGGFFKTLDSLNYNTNNSFKSYVVRSNVDVNISPKLMGGIYLLGRIMNSSEPGASTGTILSNLMNTPANAYPLLNANNSFGGNQQYQNNMLAQTIASGYNQRYFRDILVNIYLQRKLDDIAKGLWVKAKVAYNSTVAEDIYRGKSFAVFQQTGTVYTQFGSNGTQANGNGVAYQGRTDYEELSLGYDRKINSNNEINAILLYNRDNSFNGVDLPYTITGTSGRIGYNYKSKYVVEGAFAYNGSNRYPDNGATKRGFFPSVGLGWNMENENFIKSIPFISKLKLYSSYGMSGWDNPGYFVYYPRFFDGPAAIFGTGAGGVTTITEGVLPNTNITWEKVNKFNVGVNGSFLNNRLGLVAEYFNNRYYDLLQQRGSNSSILGNTYPDENIGKNKYFGWEFQASWQQTVKKVQFFVSFNATLLNSKVIFMDEVSRPYAYMQRTGQQIGKIFGYVADGLFQSQTEINSSPATVGYKAQPGDIKYKDLNGDGVINQNDQTAIGSKKPLLYGGVNLGLSFHGFDISALFQGVKNRDIYASGSSYWGFVGGTGQAYNHNLYRWTPATAANAIYPRLSYGDNTNNYAVSSYWIRNGNYLRLKNLEIGYSLPQTLIAKIRLQTVRLFANGYNLFTKASSQLDGRDPEAFSGGYPIQSVFNFGLNIKF